MKKKFTLLIMATALLLGGGSAKVYSQETYGDNKSLSGDQSYTIQVGVGFNADNNFGPGEVGTIRPSGSGASTDRGIHSTNPLLDLNPFNLDNGRITVGGTLNKVLNVNNVASVTRQCSAINSCVQVNHTVTVSASGAPPLPDGSGSVTTNNAVTWSNSQETKITVDATTKVAAIPWSLQQFYFLQNGWYYNKYNIYADLAQQQPHTAGGNCTETCYTGGGSPYSCVVYRTASCSHDGVYFSNTPDKGGDVDGRIVLVTGSHVRLRGDATMGKSISSGTLGGTTAYLDLPNTGSTTTFYSLMNDDDVNVANITVSNLATLAPYAVFGINTSIDKAISTNATNGGTILLGSNVSNQNLIKITPTTSPAASTVTKLFQKSGDVYTGSHYLHNAANLGNYGTNNVTITNAQTMVTATGTAGLQIFNQNGTCNSNALYFNGTPVAITNGKGALLIDARGAVDFYQSSTFTATATDAGHTTIRGGNEVRFRNAHTYTGTKASDYWVHAVGGVTYNGTTYCGVGDILSMAAAPVIVSNTGSTGDLTWEAKRDINTKGTVEFTADQTTQVDWIAHDRNIHTENTVKFAHSGAGQTKWYAKKNIWTEKAVNFSQTSTGATYWHAVDEDIIISKGTLHAGPLSFEKTNASSGYTEWRAGNNIITRAKINFKNNGAGNTKWLTDRQDILTYDWVDFLNTSTGNTDWQAQRHITTNDTVTFTNTGTGNTKWWAVTGNITTNKGSENGFVTFNNSGATGANTDWQARLNIFTNNVVTFNNSSAVANAYIKWWAETQNIEMNDSTTFNQLGTAPNSTLRGQAVGYTPSAGSLWLLAKKNILSENGSINNPNNEEPLLINYSANNNAPVKLQAIDANVILDGVLHVNRQNTGTSETTIEAGRDIHFLDTVTFLDKSTADILLHAHRDIRVNDSTCNNNKTAPVTFEVTKDARTRWIADRNLHTSDTMNFKYNNTNKTVKGLDFVAQGGNITTDRWFNVDFDGNTDILFSAVMNNHPYNYQINPGAGGPVAGRVNNGVNSFAVNRNTVDGNIFFNDSMKITRINNLAGNTHVLAKYNIRTAMVDYTDKASAGNNTTVESYMGDIFLGYSTNDDNCQLPPQNNQFSYDLNRFLYTVSAQNTTGGLKIKAGYDDNVDNVARDNGGNIYFTHIDATMGKTGTHSTEISIPFSNEYYCGSSWSSLQLADLGAFTDPSRMMYEHAGIIGGVGPCGHDDHWAYNYDPSQRRGNSAGGIATDTSLIYHGNKGALLVDAGLRGNVIMNRGTYLNFQADNGNTEFRTRWGNIDMRYPFNADSLQGSLLFLASSDLPNKLKTSVCGCDEERNNVYLQDFRYYGHTNSGSVFVGADNNIKLQYGGLKTIGTSRDPFFSPNNNQGYPCGSLHHCDADTAENQARDLILNFAVDTFNAAITSGGFAAVASDLIDVYKNMIYTGGQGTGMSSVPKYGQLHGEGVAGYGLYIKTQANKSNWGKNAFDASMNACVPTKCDVPCDVSKAILQNVARVTFHADARVYTENQRSYIGSPVLESYGNLDLNTHQNKGAKTGITIQTDSLIMHDSMILDGKHTHFTTWSGLYRDMPIFKFGHQRFTPPAKEDGGYCANCFTHNKGKGDLDTVFVTFRNGASVDRLHTLVADHTVLSFLTDSFDHVKGDPVINAKFYTDTFKVRNHVELFSNPKHTNDGHFELISEEQMESKDYAGIYARHLHMEPIAPECDNSFSYSQLWLPDPALDVITTSTFGGYGWLHADVHIEIEATLAPGFASLREKGNYCYELKAGTLRMQDLRLDKGAEIRYSIGNIPGFDDELVDCIEVDEITLYGDVNVIVEKRCGQSFDAGRCYPIIRYNSVAIDSVNLNNLKLQTKKLDGYNLSLDTSNPGVVYLCVGETGQQMIMREVLIPQTAGVTTNPEYGAHYVPSQNNFKFSAKYATDQPLKVTTNRVFDGEVEELTGTLNANGEYVYVIRQVTQNIVLKFGPEFATSNESFDGKAVWSHGNTIYIRVEKDDIASIYSITGQLVKRIELAEGSEAVPMERGVYIVTLKDGSVHKVILK